MWSCLHRQLDAMRTIRDNNLRKSWLGDGNPAWMVRVGQCLSIAPLPVCWHLEQVSQI